MELLMKDLEISLSDVATKGLLRAENLKDKYRIEQVGHLKL